MQSAMNNRRRRCRLRRPVRCATCHGYINAAWLDRIPPKSQGEAALLEIAAHVQA